MVYFDWFLISRNWYKCMQSIDGCNMLHINQGYSNDNDSSEYSKHRELRKGYWMNLINLSYLRRVLLFVSCLERLWLKDLKLLVYIIFLLVTVDELLNQVQVLFHDSQLIHRVHIVTDVNYLVLTTTKWKHIEWVFKFS